MFLSLEAGFKLFRVVESIKQLWIKIAFKHLKSHSSRLSWFRTFLSVGVLIKIRIHRLMKSLLFIVMIMAE